VLALWQGAVAAGLASAAFVSPPVSVARSLWQLAWGGKILPNLDRGGRRDGDSAHRTDGVGRARSARMEQG